MRRQFQGYALLTAAMVTVGSTVGASKIIGGGLPAFSATALRFAIAFPVFLALLRLTGARWPALARRDWLVLLIQAGAGSVGYTTLLIAGMRLSSSADAAVILGTLPVAAAAISIAVLGERPHPALLVAIALALLGVLSIAAQPQGAGARSLAGNACVFGAVVCESLFILLNKRIRTEIAPLALSAIMTGLGLAIAIVPALFEAPWRIALPAEALAAVAYYAIVPTVGGFVLWYAGSARVSGTEASLFTAVAPVSALLFAATLMGEQVRAGQLFGIACVLAAVAGMAFVPPPRPARA